MAFMNGEMTPKELHAKVAWAGKQCNGCGGKRLTLRVKILAPVGEVVARNDALARLITIDDQMLAGLLQACVPTIHGPYVMVSDAFACRLCQRNLEKAAASSTVPSWCIVEFDRGPNHKESVHVAQG